MSAILFLAIYLCSGSGFSELLKVGTLLEHFRETEKNDKAVTFLQFLVMHYITDDLNDKDNDRDSRLPFKSAEAFLSGMAFTYVSNQVIEPMVHPSFAVPKNDYVPLKYLFAPSKYHTLVWHPPKYS